MADFTPTQGQYLSYIVAYTDRHGYPPAESEIAAALCVSAPSVSLMVKTLERKGLIQRQPGQSRTIQVLVPDEEIPRWNSRRRGSAPTPAANLRRGTSGKPVCPHGLSGGWTRQREVCQQGRQAGDRDPG